MACPIRHEYKPRFHHGSCQASYWCCWASLCIHCPHHAWFGVETPPSPHLSTKHFSRPPRSLTARRTPIEQERKHTRQNTDHSWATDRISKPPTLLLKTWDWVSRQEIICASDKSPRSCKTKPQQ